MASEEKVREWRKDRRLSIQRLRVVVPLAVGLWVVFWLMSWAMTLPWLLILVIVAAPLFEIIGDTVNVIYLDRKLETARGLEEREGRSVGPRANRRRPSA